MLWSSNEQFSFWSLGATDIKRNVQHAVDNDAVHGGGYATGAVKGTENNINNNNLHSGL